MGNIKREPASHFRQSSLTGSLAQFSGDTILEALMGYGGYVLVLLGGIIVVQQLISYLMYVRIRQLLNEVYSIEGQIKITDMELENLISRVEEFKNDTI
jgi:hypothetical protein